MTDPSRSAAGVLARIHVNPEGGAPKHRVAQAELTTDGVVGDRQRDLRHHGGPTRAVCLFSLERIEALAAEGHPIAPGTTGENLTVAGLDWGRFAPGVALRVGDVQLELTDFAPPCKTIVDSFAGGEFKRIAEKVNPGWSRIYARVVRPGVVREGDVVELADAATRDAAVEDATPDAPGPDASLDAVSFVAASSDASVGHHRATAPAGISHEPSSRSPSTARIATRWRPPRLMSRTTCAVLGHAVAPPRFDLVDDLARADRGRRLVGLRAGSVARARRGEGRRGLRRSCTGRATPALRGARSATTPAAPIAPEVPVVADVVAGTRAAS